ncbi:putative drug exporter of the RND superfamily [Kytococcus aerolatus]|uniref:Putative drug exporter of the RND superfamily n=1 Tax=Kytococcus aerolatus TaxID=592308 RepID=A0A212TFW1_9MICO|nr:MMPL family transporter [Kytococcus aerolatus]SNC64912.1 putative drug exporter of the RND superfamily [Kytococcus aerolatus]
MPATRHDTSPHLLPEPGAPEADAPGPARWLVGRVGAPLVALLALLLVVGAMALLPGADDAGAPQTLPDRAESARVNELLAELPGGESAPAVVVVEKTEGRLDRQEIGALAQQAPLLVEALPADARPDGPAARAVQGPIPSEDGRAALLVVPVPADALTRDAPGVAEALREAAPGLVPGTTTHVTGAAGFAADTAGAFEGANLRLLLATAAVVAVLLVLTYRSPVLWIVPLVVVGLADRLATTVSGTVLGAVGVPFDGSTAGITSVLVFGAGTNYALLLVSRYRDELRRTADHRLALGRAWRAALPAILASNLTVVLTLALLLLAGQPSTRALGTSAAVGLLVALVLALTLLPALLALCGRGLFWPLVPRPGDRDTTEHGLWHRIAVAVQRRPATVLAASLAVLGLMATGLLGARVGLAQSDQFRLEADSVEGLAVIEEHYPAGAATPLTVLLPTDGAGDGRSATAERATRALRAVEGVSSVQPTGGGEAGGRTWDRLQVTLTTEPASAEAREAVEAVRTSALEVDRAALVGGSEAEAVDLRAGVLRDMAVVTPLMLLMVLAVLVVVLRSLVAPLLLVAISVVGSLAALGAGALLSEHVFGFPALDSSVPLYSVLFLVALGIDYTIFLVVRAREELLAGRHRETGSAMVRAVSATGGVITSAGIVLAAVFVVLGVLPLITLTQVGIVVGLGILVDTFLVRTVVVPAVFELLGDRVWWPHRLARRDSPR